MEDDLVAVVQVGGGGDGRREKGVETLHEIGARGLAERAAEEVRELPALGLDLGRVVHVVVDAARHTCAVGQTADGCDAAGCGLCHVDELCLGEARVGARDARLDALPGADTPVDEDDGTTLGAQDARAAVGDGFDGAGEKGAGVHGGKRG